MKKEIVLFICLILFMSSSVTIGQIQDNQNINLSFNFSKPQYVTSNDMSSFIIPEAKDVFIKYSYFMQPMSAQTYYFPKETQIEDIKATTSQVNKLSTTNPFISSPTPYLLSTGQPIDRIDANELQTIKTWFSYNVGQGVIDGEICKILNIELYPMIYDQEKHELSWTENIDLTITIITNHQNNQVSYDEKYELVVISPQIYVEKLINLVEHKISRNISTKLVTIDEITKGVYFPSNGRDIQENIKYFIKNALENWGTSYVLLVGGSTIMPIRETHVAASSTDNEIFASDLYYADIYNESGSFSSWDSNENNIFAEYNWGDEKLSDELDLYPDVYLGRLACTSAEEVQNVVQKIINYENNRAYTTDWFTNIITVGGDTFTDESGDNTGTNEGEVINEYVIDIMEGFLPNRLWSTNGKLGGVSPTGISEIEAAFNTGAGFVDFSGHGNTYVFATHHNNGSTWIPTPTGGLLNSQIMQFTNEVKLPIVVTGACSVGKFNRNDNCFSWSFVSNPNGGAIASAGATALGYGYIGKWITSGLIEKIAINMFDAYMNGAMTFGEMWADAVSSYISIRMDGADYKTVLEWQSFGDPTLALAESSEPPLKPDSPEGPEKGSIRDAVTYTAHTTDPEGDEIYYLFDWGNGDYSGWIGPFDSGEQAEAKYQWDKRGDYEIRVKAKDSHGRQSDWSDSKPISMPYRYIHSYTFLEQIYKKTNFIEKFIDTISNQFLII